MKSLPSTSSGLDHEVCRASVFDDLLSLYKKCESLPQEYPLEMKFTAERAVDLGGVSRDVMTAFWQDACEKLFDGNKLLVPVVSPHIDLSLLTTIGKILSHGYLCTGYLPTQISFPSLAAMLLGPSVNIDFSVLIESFLDYVSDVERSVLKSAVEIAKHTSKTAFPSDVQEELLTVLCNYGCRQIPSPSTLSQIVADIARFVFLTNPMSALCMINSGIPSQHHPFWSSKSPADLYHLYQALTATPTKVLSLIDKPYCANQAQKLVFGYLRQYDP